MKRIAYALLATALLNAPVLWAADETAPIAFNDTSKKLEASYAAQMETLKAELLDALPTLDPKAKADYLAYTKVHKS